MEPYRQQLTRLEAQAQQDPLFFRDERSLPPNPHLLVLTPWPSLSWSWPPDRPPLGPDLLPLSWSWPPDPLFLGPHPLTPSPFGRGGTRGWGRGGCATAFRPLAGGGPLGMWAAAAGGRTGALRTSFGGVGGLPDAGGVSHPRPITPQKRPFGRCPDRQIRVPLACVLYAGDANDQPRLVRWRDARQRRGVKRPTAPRSVTKPSCGRWPTPCGAPWTPPSTSTSCSA